MRNVTAQRDHAQAFTLVELLVVIGIIAILISILLPSLARARQGAITVQCLANLRTIGQGLALYAQDNKDFYPFGFGTNYSLTPNQDFYWTTTIAATLNSRDTNPWSTGNNTAMVYFRCPEVNVDRSASWVVSSHYAGHPVVFPARFWPYGPLGGKVLPHYKSVWLAKNGSDKAIAWDGTVQTNPADNWCGAAQPVGGHVDGSQYWWGTRGIDAMSIWESAVANTGYSESQASLDGAFQDMPANRANNTDGLTFRARHNGGNACNFLFADGHVETRPMIRNGTYKDKGTTDLKHSNFTVPLPIPGLKRVGT